MSIIVGTVTSIIVVALFGSIGFVALALLILYTLIRGNGRLSVIMSVSLILGIWLITFFNL